MKTIIDFYLALVGIIFFSPIFILFSIMIWMQDGECPFYVAPRVGQDNSIFKMIKFRSMVINADQSDIDSTSENDSRITYLGKFIRKIKIDEMPNLINILFGKMSFVGPRPNVERETRLYTNEEKKLLRVKPGITDLASIVFSDEGKILAYSKNPDLLYNQLIRPWKSRLGIFYLQHRSLIVDIKIILLTFISIFVRETALKLVKKMIEHWGADQDLIDLVMRKDPLIPTPPPGSDQIITVR